MSAKLNPTGLRLALATGAIIILIASSILGMSQRWFRGPYPSFGKEVAWRLGYPEAGYNFDVVAAGKLYRSGRPDERFVRYIHKFYGIRHIVSLSGPLPAHETARQLGMRVTVFTWAISEPPPIEEYRAVFNQLGQQGPVLVHCSSGSDRAGYAVIAYRVVRQHWSLAEAVEETKHYWHDPARHPAWHQALPQLIQQVN